jgi:hypothetical protein
MKEKRKMEERMFNTHKGREIDNIHTNTQTHMEKERERMR